MTEPSDLELIGRFGSPDPEVRARAFTQLFDRIGLGLDIHPLVAGDPLILGGVEIPFGKRLQGHSDGDVLVHAVCDALLGAAGEPDLGEIFPPGEERTKGISSILLLEEVARRLQAKGLRGRRRRTCAATAASAPRRAGPA